MSEDTRIIYILIGKDKTPLVGYSEHTGDFIQTCENMLDKVTKDSSAAVNLGTGFTIFYTNENDITYLIMANSSYPKSTAIGCIESIKNEFQSTYRGRDFDSEQEYGLNDDFKEKLKMKYEYYTKNPEAVDEHVEELKNVVLAFKNQVIQAAEVLNERGEDLNKLSDQSKLLEQDSYSFKKGAIEVRRTECKRKIWYIIAIVLVIGIIIGIIIWVAS